MVPARGADGGHVLDGVAMRVPPFLAPQFLAHAHGRAAEEIEEAVSAKQGGRLESTEAHTHSLNKASSVRPFIREACSTPPIN